MSAKRVHIKRIKIYAKFTLENCDISRAFRIHLHWYVFAARQLLKE